MPRDEWPSPPLVDDASTLIFNWRGTNGLCAETILDSYDSYPITMKVKAFSLSSSIQDFARHFFASLVIYFLYYIPSSFTRSITRKYCVAQLKFPRLKASRLRSDISSLEEILDPKNSNYSFKYLSPKVILLSPK